MSRRPSQRKPSGPAYGGGRREPPERLYIYGLHPVEAALANPRRTVLAAFATENALRRLEERGVRFPSPPEIVHPKKIDALVPAEAVHQGCVLEVAPLEPPTSADFEGMRLIVVLDQVTDPHNVGAVMRSAVALGADAIVTTRRHSPVESGVLAKSASGALDMIPHVEARNLARLLADLGERGFQRIGLDSEGDSPLEEIAFAPKVALVMGSEGKGLRQGTRAVCDALARLDMPGPIKSLNVSNAAVLALYIARRGSRAVEE